MGSLLGIYCLNGCLLFVLSFGGVLVKYAILEITKWNVPRQRPPWVGSNPLRKLEVLLCRRRPPLFSFWLCWKHDLCFSQEWVHHVNMAFTVCTFGNTLVLHIHLSLPPSVSFAHGCLLCTFPSYFWYHRLFSSLSPSEIPCHCAISKSDIRILEYKTHFSVVILQVLTSNSLFWNMKDVFFLLYQILFNSSISMIDKYRERMMSSMPPCCVISRSWILKEEGSKLKALLLKPQNICPMGNSFLKHAHRIFKEKVKL